MKPSVLSLPSSAVAHPRKGRREAIRDPQADVEALCVRDPPSSVPSSSGPGSSVLLDAATFQHDTRGQFIKPLRRPECKPP